MYIKHRLWCIHVGCTYCWIHCKGSYRVCYPWIALIFCNRIECCMYYCRQRSTRLQHLVMLFQVQQNLTYLHLNCLAAQIIWRYSGSSSSSSSCKRKCVVLTLEQKQAILDRLKKGESQEKLASEYGAGRSMISDIKKSEEKLKSYASTMESLSMSLKTRKVMRLADDEKLDEAVCLWFVQ